MERERWRGGLLLIAGALILLALVVIAVRLPGEGHGRSVAGILDNKGKVVVVDLESGRTVRNVRLRSRAFDIDADSSNGTFVTAQSGGVDIDADDKIGIIPLRALSPVSYVKLPRPNPSGVEIVGDGLAVADHGWVDEQGTFVTLVDTDRKAVVKSGHVPDLNMPLRQANGLLWACCAAEDGRRSLRRVHPATLKSEEMMAGHEFPLVETSGPLGLYGWLVPEPQRGILARFNPKTGAVEATRPVRFEDGPGRMLYCRGKLVAADFTGASREIGTRVLVLDPATLKLEREIRVAGGPCDMAVWRDRVVVCSYRDQELLLIDPVTGKTDKTIELPKMSALPFQIAVMD